MKANRKGVLTFHADDQMWECTPCRNAAAVSEASAVMGGSASKRVRSPATGGEKRVLRIHTLPLGNGSLLG